MTHPTPAPRAELRWAAVDFDGTLAEGLWSPGNQTAALGAPIAANMLKVWALHNAGYRIVIHTARPSSDHEAIEMWLHHYGVPYASIATGKPLAAIYVDDRAVHADTDWLAQAELIAKAHQ